MSKKQRNPQSKKDKRNWMNYTLEQLEDRSWGIVEEGCSNLVRRCISLGKIPVKDLTAADLRVLIGQQFSLEYLVPLAVEKLEDNLLLDTEFYEGDLLENLLKIKTDFWNENKTLWEMMHALLERKKDQLNDAKIDISRFTQATFYNIP